MFNVSSLYDPFLSTEAAIGGLVRSLSGALPGPTLTSECYSPSSASPWKGAVFWFRSTFPPGP